VSFGFGRLFVCIPDCRHFGGFLLAKKVLEEKGKVVSKRVIETSPQPKIEITFEASGTIRT
jgi:hypothetical protein